MEGGNTPILQTSCNILHCPTTAPGILTYIHVHMRKGIEMLCVVTLTYIHVHMRKGIEIYNVMCSDNYNIIAAAVKN